MKPEELSLAIREGKLDEAAASLAKERDEVEERQDFKKSAELTNDLGVVHYTAGHYPEARVELDRARTFFAGSGNLAGQARTMGNLARLEEKLGNGAAAEKLYWEASELFHQAGEREDEFATMRTLSQLYLKRGGYLQSLATFDHALQIKPGRGPMEAVLHRIYQIPLRMFGIGSS